jgi:hypothetical protein
MPVRAFHEEIRRGLVERKEREAERTEGWTPNAKLTDPALAAPMAGRQ